MKKNVIRLLFALVALLTSTSMLAENKLWIASEGNGSFAIMMNCDEDAAAMQFNLQLPKELSIRQVNWEGKEQWIYRNPERFSNGQQIRSNLINDSRQNVLCMIVSMLGESFTGENGTPVAYFQTYKSDPLSTWKQEDLKLTDIIFSTGDGTQLPAAEESVYDGSIYGELAVYFDVENLVINPAPEGQTSTVKVPVALKNSFPVSGLQMNITLPEGFTMGTEFEHTDRVSTTAQIKTLANGSSYSLVMTDIVDNLSIPYSGNGTIFYCFVNVPDGNVFKSNVDFKISEVGASNVDGKFVTGNPSSITVINGGLAYDKANETLKGLSDALKAALETISTDAPDVKDDFLGEDITAAIAALQKTVDETYADGTLTANYDDVMAGEYPEDTKNLGVDEISADIAKLIEDAKAAQAQYEKDQADAAAAEAERVKENTEKYNADIAALDALQENLDNTVTVIDAEYADYKDEAAIEAVQKQIDDTRAAAEAAFAAVEKEGVYESPLDEAAINTAIDGLLTAAEAAKAEADKKAEEDAAKAEQLRKDENKAAYDAVMAELNKLYASYRTTVAEIQADYKPYEDVSAELALRNALDAEKDAIEYAYKAVEKEGKFEYDLDSEALQAQIDKLLEDAKALAEKTESDRVAANQAAYDADKDEILALQAELDAAVEKILAEYPGYKDVTVESRNIDKAINDAQKGADEALAACKEEGTYSYDWNPQAIRDMIAEMLKKAEADGVEAIIADVEAGNAVVFTLDGKKHARPVNGEVNIIVRRNGEKSKVFVK